MLWIEDRRDFVRNFHLLNQGHSLLAFVAEQVRPAIPYRTAAPVSTGSVFSSLLCTALLLAALIGVLLYSRRRGWLPSARIASSPANDEKGIRLLSSRRLSMATTAHIVEFKGRAFLVVESSRGVTSTLTPLDDAIAGTLPEDEA